MLNNADLQRYREDAVAFSVKGSRLSRERPIRVASTLVTCSLAAAALTELGVPGEADETYLYVNVHNPKCPLHFDADLRQWKCAAAYENHPVWGINWAGACLISEHMGGRLPSEREWCAFASNNDPHRTYPWGNAPPTAELANFGEHFGGVTSVRSFPPSELGLYDLAGNLCEWCCDRYAVAEGLQSPFERVVKGGGWSKDARHLEIAASRGKWERLGTTTIGLRPVWDDNQ